MGKLIDMMKNVTETALETFKRLFPELHGGDGVVDQADMEEHLNGTKKYDPYTHDADGDGVPDIYDDDPHNAPARTEHHDLEKEVADKDDMFNDMLEESIERMKNDAQKNVAQAPTATSLKKQLTEIRNTKAPQGQPAVTARIANNAPMINSL